VSILDVRTDPDALTVTISAHFRAPIERVWRLWSDPRRLERWWAPPGYTAAFASYDLRPGAEVAYSMTGAGGDRHAGLWRIVAADPPTTLELDDVFADADGVPVAGMPVVRVSVRLSGREDGTGMEIVAGFASRDELERWLATGTREGMRAAVAQMDALLDADEP
jgi:uncharacterized protein YndB with AHSA1/START domain